MDTTRHLIISITLSLIIIMMGTIGYMLIEKWPLLDSLYMTIITISTVGFSEVNKVSGDGRIFTIILVLVGVGFSLYVAGAIVQFMVEGRIRLILGRRRLERKIDRIRDHYIVCGYGRIGRVLCKNLNRTSVNIVVVEKDREMIPTMDADGVLYLSGDAADEEILLKAGIDRAKGLVAALATDMDNVFLVLTARQLNADLKIIARASQESSKKKLRAAGATSVESPYEMGAISMAQRILRPTVTNFLDLALAHQVTDIQMEEIPVSPQSRLANVMLKDSGIRQKFNLIIVAIKKPDGTMLFNPNFEAIIKPEDTLIAIGERVNLGKLETLLGPN